MRANANPPRAFAVAAASLVAALAIAACGSDSDSDASGDSGSGGDSALVKQADERVAQARQPIEEFSGPSEPAGAPPAGKSVAMVNVIPGPFPNHLEEGVEEAATAVGWDVRGFSADGTPQGFQTTLSAALATNPDAIVLLAMPAALVQQQLVKAKQQGVEVVALSPGLPPGKTPEQWNLLNAIGYEAAPIGEALGYWVIQASPGGAEAIALDSPEFVDIQAASKGFQKVLEEGAPDFSVATVVNSPVTDTGGGQSGVNRLATPIRKYPDADFMYINSESWVPTFLQAAQAANRTGEVTALGADGDASIPLIKEGQPIVMMGSPARTYGWYAVDALIRQWNGKPQQEYEIPTTLVDAENADEYETDYIEVTYDVAKEWESLWR